MAGDVERIAFLSDFHLGYPRFREDAFKQAKAAVEMASERADLLVVAGDIFDRTTPSLDVLKEALEIFASCPKPCLITHGNHERRTKGFTNAVELLARLPNVRYVHGECVKFPSFSITMLGYVPEEFASTAISQLPKEHHPDLSFLVIHQSVREFCLSGEGLAVEELLSLPYTFVVCGHLHRNGIEDRIVFPGSTVVTQIREEEVSPRGFFVYDIPSNSWRFVPIPSRRVVLERVEFERASLDEIREVVQERITALKMRYPEAIIKLVLQGTLREGLSPSDVCLPDWDNVFISNELQGGTLLERLREIKHHSPSFNVEHRAMALLKERVKLKLFNVEDLLRLLEEDEADIEEYIEGYHDKDFSCTSN